MITDANLTSRLDNLDSYPGLKHWLGSPQEWRDILNSIVGATLGGQKRRLGRFLFACKAGNYREQVQSQVKLLQQSGETDVTFHIVVGLAGGTGSGSVIDAVAQLRDLYPDSKRFRILIYALLPDAYPHPNWDTGNYHANGFAALTELNAMSVGSYQPYDVTGVKQRLTLSDPFNGCYVFGNENENGLTVDVDKDLPGIVADFLYQKIVAVNNVNWASLGRMENAENGDGSPETAPQGRMPERSKRFLAFGIKRLAIPEEEISEYLTYSFARQAALQLRFNHWQPASGFIDEPRKLDFNEFVQQKETQLRWLLSDDHLTLALGILPEDANNKRWKSFTGEWEAVIPNFKSLVRERERATWLDELTKLCEKRFQDDYRTLGVSGFYRTKLKARKDMAREIRTRIEQELINEWKVGAKSAWDVSRLLIALTETLDERLKACDDNVVRARNAEEQAQSRVLGNLQKWSGMSLLSKHLLGTPDSLLDAHGVHLQEMYVYRTRAEGWGFAKALLIEVIAEDHRPQGRGGPRRQHAAAGAKKVRSRHSGAAQRCRFGRPAPASDPLLRPGAGQDHQPPAGARRSRAKDAKRPGARRAGGKNRAGCGLCAVQPARAGIGVSRCAGNGVRGQRPHCPPEPGAKPQGAAAGRVDHRQAA